MQIMHLVLVLLVVVILFGAGKLPRVMGDIGKGIKNLRDELNGDEKNGKQQVLPPEEKK